MTIHSISLKTEIHQYLGLTYTDFYIGTVNTILNHLECLSQHILSWAPRINAKIQI